MSEILRWVVGTFDWYQDVVLDALQHDFDSGGEGMNLLQCLDDVLVCTFHEPLDGHYLPLIDGWASSCNKIVYTVDVNQARLWFSLNGTFDPEPERTGTIRFLDLPPELRNRVYEMVLVYPRSTLAVIPKLIWDPSELETFTLRAVERDGGGLTGGDRKERYEIRYIHWDLTITKVCKQIFKETIPIFYGSNTYLFDETRILSNFIKTVPATRAHHLQSFHLNLTVYNVVRAQQDAHLVSVLESAAGIFRLKKLTLSYVRKKRGKPKVVAARIWKTLGDTPSMHALARLAATVADEGL